MDAFGGWTTYTKYTQCVRPRKSSDSKLAYCFSAIRSKFGRDEEGSQSSSRHTVISRLLSAVLLLGFQNVNITLRRSTANARFFHTRRCICWKTTNTTRHDDVGGGGGRWKNEPPTSKETGQALPQKVTRGWKSELTVDVKGVLAR
eukprot:scaffold10394_cov173-Amphora_coffeaeformis.AAC.7